MVQLDIPAAFVASQLFVDIARERIKKGQRGCWHIEKALCTNCNKCLVSVDTKPIQCYKGKNTTSNF